MQMLTGGILFKEFARVIRVISAFTCMHIPLPKLLYISYIFRPFHLICMRFFNPDSHEGKHEGSYIQTVGNF
jgi:hypothetical protein